MSPKEALDKIQALFTETTEVVKVELKNYDTADGKKVSISALEVGGTIEADGQPYSGSTILADGTEVVAEAGVITEVKLPEAAPEEEMKDLNKEQIEKLSSQLNENIEKFTASFSELTEKLNAQELKFGKAIIDLCALVEGLMTTSAVETTKPSEKFKHTESKQDKISRFLEMAKQIRKN